MLKNNTGKGKPNKPADVIILQLLLNQVNIAGSDADGYTIVTAANPSEPKLLLPKLSVDGIAGQILIKRIENYQAAKKIPVDGWMSPTGGTLKKLIADAHVTPNTNRMAFIRSALKSTLVSAIQPDKVVTLYEKQYANFSKTEYKDGLSYILTTAKSDSAVTFIPELAYMLATTKHETAHTFIGIEEYGKGAGKDYGKEITVTDTATKKVYKNKYYGRGYVQLTWGYNYQNIDQHLGNGDYPNRGKPNYNDKFTVTNPAASVYLHPEKMLENSNAYTALVWGMQNGIFTTKKIGSYVNSKGIDYVNARRVINGTDKANDIAAYAEDFEIMLRVTVP